MTGPSLADLLCAPERVRDLPREEIPVLLAALGGLVVTLSARLATPAETEPGPSENGDRLLTAKEVCDITRQSREWVWRRARRMDWARFTVRPSRKVLLVREAGLRRWLAQQGRP